MSIPRIYCPQTYVSGDEIRLEPNASRHLLKVLRLRQGDPVILFNGKRGEFDGILQSADKRQADIKVGDYRDKPSESPLNIHLVYGLARFEKTEWVIQKATELGVNRITPVMTQHGEVHLPDKAIPSRLERWHSIVIGACEQSGRCLIPTIERPLRFNDWIKQPLSLQGQGTKLIFHLQGYSSLSQRSAPESGEITLLVGAEGGFSAAEVQLAIQNGFEMVGLGPRILRTETAAISAITAIQAIWGDLLL